MLRARSLKQGVSLIELIMVIAMIAILLVAALPSFTVMLANIRVRSVADTVLGGVQAARAEALKRNLDVTFRIKPEAALAWSVVLASGTMLQSLQSSQIGTVSIAASDESVTEVVFNNLGRRTQPTPAAINVLGINVSAPYAGTCEEVGGTVRCLRVTIAIGGEARLCDPKRPVGDPQAC